LVHGFKSQRLSAWIQTFTRYCHTSIMD